MLNNVLVKEIRQRSSYLRRLRKQKGLTQQQIALMLNISQNSYWKIENGETKVKVDVVLALSNIFGVSVADFIENIT